MWNLRNNEIFKNYSCILASSIEHSLKTYHKKMCFNKQNNMFLQDNIIGTALGIRNSRATKHQLIPPPPSWYKWNMLQEWSRQSIPPSVMPARTIVKKFFSFRNDYMNCPALVADTLTIREAIKTVIQVNLDNIIMESDSQVPIYSIMDKIVAQNQISNLVDDINSIIRNIKNITFASC